VPEKDIKQTLKLTADRPWKATAASLALAAPADTGPSLALPGNTIPAHVQAAVAAQTVVVDAAPTAKPDDLLAKW
jgi:hypothetical protein